MNLRILVVSVLLSAIGCASAFALAPMGPPTATLKTGQFRAGFDYSLSQTDIEADWESSTELYKDVQSNLFAANIGYGISDDWEVFVRLGVSNAEFDEYEIDGVSQDDDYGFRGDYGFLFGFGTKLTWAKQENLNWGALFQIHWLNSEHSYSVLEGDPEDYYEIWDYEENLDRYEIQVAVGPTWMVNEALSIYGGPFFHFIGGNFDYDAAGVASDETPLAPVSASADLEAKSSFGGYVGAQYELDANASVYAEFQFTGDAWALGTGIGWKI